MEIFYFYFLLFVHIYNINYIKLLLQLACNCYFFTISVRNDEKISRDVRKYFISRIDTCKNKNAPAVVQVS